MNSEARPEARIGDADDGHALLEHVQALTRNEVGDAVELLHRALAELVLGQVVNAVGRG